MRGKQSGNKKLNVAVVDRPESAGPMRSSSSDSASHTTTAQSLEQVRDILFGAQARDQEQQIMRVEESLQHETAEMKKDFMLRFESLEQFMKKELELLTSRIKAERGVRADLIRDLGKEVKDLTKTVEKKVSHLDDQLGKGLSELNQKILDQQKTLSWEIQEKSDALKYTMKKAIQELNENKVENAALSEILLNGAMSLSNDLKVAVESTPKTQKSS
ncbi:MAG: hypothetical protein DHS20C13_29680 [Thermodesulfobacteriota bacterium]|nr:MAG: hypothetical protein DHS20C13_29680 [Thermodesulfobacteriota bacterium]